MNLCAIGTGAITKSMLAEFQRSDVLRCTSIYSRKEETGKAMAEQFGLERVYTSIIFMTGMYPCSTLSTQKTLR